MVQPTPTTIASPQVHSLLQRLHKLSAAQENSYSQKIFYLSRLARYYLFSETWTAAADDHMRDKFVSLESDKCEFVYLLARSIGATRIVEAGTSFGVSTNYLALAVGQNVGQVMRMSTAGITSTGKVIATQKEPTKAAKAREHWREAGAEVEPWIELREGDLLETLKIEEGMPEQIDMLPSISHCLIFRTNISDLVVWTPLALPTLKIIQPRLRHGALVIADNVVMVEALYKDFLAYIRDPENGFRTLTTPYRGGLEVSVYLPQK